MAMLKQQDAGVGSTQQGDPLFSATVSETLGLTVGGGGSGGGGSTADYNKQQDALPVTGPQIIEALPEKPPKEYPEKPNPYTNTTEPVAPITEYNAPVPPPSSLENVLTLSKTSSDRAYVKGSVRNIADDTIRATNTSDVMTIAVNFTGIAGVSFDPKQFNLSPMEQKDVLVHFDPIEFEKLPEGVNAINTIIDVSAVSVVETQVEKTIPARPIFIQSSVERQIGVLNDQPVITAPVIQQQTTGGSGGGGILERRINQDTGQIEIVNTQVNQA